MRRIAIAAAAALAVGATLMIAASPEARSDLRAGFSDGLGGR